MGQNRVAELYDYLCEYKLVSSIKDFGDQTHIARSIASLLISGKTRLSEKYLQRICSTFSFVNPDWLRSGNGEMFNSPVPISEETLKQFEDDVARMAYFREEYEREKVVVTYTVDDGDGKWHQEGQAGVLRKDSASTAKKLSKKRNAK